MTAAIANRGYFYTPHVIKSIDNNGKIDPKYTEPRYTTIDRKYFEPVIEGMTNVYNYGTARWVKIPDIEIAGKTGTVENYVRVDGERMQLTDHSVFVAFAPVENPQIALAVYIENGYYITLCRTYCLTFDRKYIKGEITRKDLEKRMLEKHWNTSTQNPIVVNLSK